LAELGCWGCDVLRRRRRRSAHSTSFARSNALSRCEAVWTDEFPLRHCAHGSQIDWVEAELESRRVLLEPEIIRGSIYKERVCNE